MANLRDHFRKTFLTGLLGAVPVVVTIYVVYWLDERVGKVVNLFGSQHYIPFLGIVITILGIYIVGVIGTSLLGRYFLKMIDGALVKVPVFSQFYSAWKQVALTPGGTEGVFSKVVLIPDETCQMHLLGFTSGRSVEGTADMLAVFVPQAPNPITGRLYFIERSRCRFLNMSTEEALKIIISTGNYAPRSLAGTTPPTAPLRS